MVYTFILLGGIWFWLLVLSEVIYLYNCMGLEKTNGSYATASFVGFLTILFCFSDLRPWTESHWGWTNFLYLLVFAVAYLAIGLLWSFFWMWPRWGAKRKKMHKNFLTEWLEKQGLRGTECPPDMKKELALYVFGNEDQEIIESYLGDVQDKSFPDQRSTRQSSSLRGSDAQQWKEFEQMVAYQDPETIGDSRLRKSVCDLRKAWLKTQKIPSHEVGNVIPERLIPRFLERINTPFARRMAHVEWANVATEPLFRKNKAKLATWAAWWPTSMLWYIGHDLFHEIYMAAIEAFAGVGQRMMHRQYRDVRADFDQEDSPLIK